MLLTVVTCMSFSAGCGKVSGTEEQSGNMSAAEKKDSEASAAEEQAGDASGAEEEDGIAAVPNDGRGELISDEDAAALEYMKKYMIEDFYGDGASYEIYAPDGSDNTDGFLSYIDHGINFFAMVYSGGGDDLPYMMLNESVKNQKREWEGNEFTDVKLGKVVKNGADRYVVAAAKGEDYYGTAYQKAVLFYLDVPKKGIGVLWQIEISEMQADETTQKMLAQMGRCYGIGLENLMPKGDWVQADTARQVEAQDVYEPEEGEMALTKVEGYQYLGQATLSFEDGEIQCPVMAPMGYQTMVKESYITSSMHGVFVSISSSSTGTDQYVPFMKRSADRWYEQKLNDESVENRNVHKSEVMEMSGYQDAYYYIVDYETPDTITGEYYKAVNVSCWIIIEEKFALTCDITLRDKDFDTSTNALLQELETAYGIDLSGYYNEE